MATPTRTSKQSVAYKKSLINSVGTVQNRGDYAMTTKAFVASVVASAVAQSTGVKLLPGMTYLIGQNITTEETTGLTKTISVGFVGGTGTELLNAASVAASGFIPAATTVVAVDAEQELSYTLGSADWVEYDGEIIVHMLESNV